MRHRRKSEKFSRPRAQRKALVKSLLTSLVTYERIKTTKSKAMAIRSYMDKLITLAKKNDLSTRRLSYKILEDRTLVKKLFDDIAPRFKDIKGGYTRVFDLGHRKGDGAAISIVELTVRHNDKRKRGETASSGAKAEKDSVSKDNQSRKSFVSGVKNIFKKKSSALK